MVSLCSLLVVSSQCPLPALCVRSADRVFLHCALWCACARKVTRHIQPLRNQCISHVLHVHCLNHEDAPPILTLSMQFVVIAMVSSRIRCLFALVVLVRLFLAAFVVVGLLFVRCCVIWVVDAQ